MTNGVGIIGQTQGANASSAAGARTASDPAVSQKFSVDTTATSVAAPALVQNPRILLDPSAGLITEYLGANGNVVSQTPSAVTVAYLRLGLTPDGLSKANAVATTA